MEIHICMSCAMFSSWYYLFCAHSKRCLFVMCLWPLVVPYENLDFITQFWNFDGLLVPISSSHLLPSSIFVSYSLILFESIWNFLTSKVYAKRFSIYARNIFGIILSIMFYIQHYLKSCRIIISVEISVLVYFMQLLHRDHLQTIKVILSQVHQFTGFYN